MRRPAELLHDRYRVPSPVDHLHSLAFHAAYHKGDAAGLPERPGDPRPAGPDDHDYLRTLDRLARETGREPDLSLEGLDAYLAAEGLRPANDTLERYQVKNPWLRRRLALAREDIGSLAGLIVFVVREAAADRTPEILDVVERHGFEIVQVVELTEAQRACATRTVRGGLWGRGPFPVSGGEPVAFVIAYDLDFTADPGSDGQVLNRRSAKAKSAVRDLVGRDLQASRRFNPLHSTDNGWQSLEALAALDDPDLVAHLRERVAGIEARMQPPWPVERYLSVHGKRARVAVVQHPVHGRVVAKLFRPGASRYFERELEARRELAHTGLVPELLEHGDNWLLSPYYEDDGSHRRRRISGSEETQLTFAAMRRLAELLTALRDRGCFLLDLGSHNLVTDPRAGLRVLDFEFLQRYPGAVPPIERDWTVLGVAGDPAVDQPVYGRRRQRWDQRVRKTVFHPVVAGLSATALTTARPTPLLRLRMRLLQWFWWTVHLLVTGARVARGVRTVDRATRAAARLTRR